MKLKKKYNDEEKLVMSDEEYNKEETCKDKDTQIIINALWAVMIAIMFLVAIFITTDTIKETQECTVKLADFEFKGKCKIFEGDPEWIGVMGDAIIIKTCMENNCDLEKWGEII